jgi:hypothetical protein
MRIFNGLITITFLLIPAYFVTFKYKIVEDSPNYARHRNNNNNHNNKNKRQKNLNHQGLILYLSLVVLYCQRDGRLLFFISSKKIYKGLNRN